MHSNVKLEQRNLNGSVWHNREQERITGSKSANYSGVCLQAIVSTVTAFANK